MLLDIGRVSRQRVVAPRPVVRGVDNDRVLIEVEFLEQVDNLAGRGVELFDHVAVESPLRASAERLGHAQNDLGPVICGSSGGIAIRFSRSCPLARR